MAVILYLLLLLPSWQVCNSLEPTAPSCFQNIMIPGSQGEVGKKGCKGALGPCGRRGAVGQKGIIGGVGDTGFPGERGDEGTNCECTNLDKVVEQMHQSVMQMGKDLQLIKSGVYLQAFFRGMIIVVMLFVMLCECESATFTSGT
uniref:Uncharacterized protein n=1 Tax=Eptatretus burgeri TaxID=7764 RepID=A0A8C4NIC9_EPTBU